MLDLGFPVNAPTLYRSPIFMSNIALEKANHLTPLKPPENVFPSQKAAVRCCSNNDEICITPLPCFNLSYGEAKEKCAAIGRRLCMAEELAKEKCCGSNNTVCNFDTALTWYSTEDVYTCTNCTLDEVFVPDKRIEQKEQAEKARLEYTANFKGMDLVKLYPKMLELLW